MRSTVSVIIPTYNRADLLRRAIDSALDQTYPPYEVIVVDDGSVDDTPKVAASYEGRIRYVRQHNQGEGPARRTAESRYTTESVMEQTFAEYLMVTGSGDYATNS